MKDEFEISNELDRLMAEYDIMPAAHPMREIVMAQIKILGWVLNKNIQTFPGGHIQR